MAIISNIAQGKYFLNDKDMFLEYGFFVGMDNSNIDDLISEFPDKERYTHDWQDENGLEFDDDYPALKSDKTFTLNGFIAASSKADWMEKYNAILEVFNSAGTLRLEYRPFSKNYNVRKQGQIQINQIGYLGGTFCSRISIPIIAIYAENYLPPSQAVVYGEEDILYYGIVNGEKVFLTN